MKCLVASLSGNPWRSLREALRLGVFNLINKFRAILCAVQTLPTGTLEALGFRWPIGGHALTLWLAVTRDRTVSFVMRTYIYDGIDYRDI